jgi:hypothetical protein
MENTIPKGEGCGDLNISMASRYIRGEYAFLLGSTRSRAGPYIYTHTHTHARTHKDTHARTNTHTHARTHARTHTHVRTHTHTHTHTHALTVLA